MSAVEAPAAAGLSEVEAGRRLARTGPNRLPPPQHRSPLAVLLSVASQPMVLLLLACTVLYALLGNVFDSAALALSIVAVVQGDGVAIVTETSARTALGKIDRSISDLAPRRSRLQLELTRLVRRVAVLALLTCVLVALVFAWHEGSWRLDAYPGARDHPGPASRGLVR